MSMKRKTLTYFQRFWPKVHSTCRAGFFKIVTFSGHICRLLVNIQCFYRLPKLEIKTLLTYISLSKSLELFILCKIVNKKKRINNNKVNGDKKSVLNLKS